MAAQVADRFDLGPDARPEVEAARGEQGQVRRLVTARGTFAVKESFDPVDAEEAQRTAEYQVSLPRRRRTVPAAVARRRGPLPRRHRRPADPGADLGRHRRPGPAARPGARRARRSRGCTRSRCRRPTRRTGGAPSPSAPPSGGRWSRPPRAPGRRSRARLAALVPDLLAVEELLTPMAGVQWCHLDLWADNLRGTPGRRGVHRRLRQRRTRRPDPRAGDGALRVRQDRRRPRARAGVGVRGGRWARPRHPRRGLRAARSLSCTTSAATRSLAG